MITFAGIFFFLISIFGFVKCQSKTSIKKIVLVAFCVVLILGQVLFMNSVLEMDGSQFLGFSGLVGGIILILALQKHAPE